MVLREPGRFHYPKIRIFSRLLCKAGLVRIQIGVESGSQEILDLYRKQVQVEEIIQAVEILQSAKVPSIYGNFHYRRTSRNS
jgi:radical SAM superfamily enzyme YgiQ (UPF0313 family)